MVNELSNIHHRQSPILAIENRRGNFIGSISNMPLTLSTQKLPNDSGQIVTYKELIKKKLETILGVLDQRVAVSIRFYTQRLK